MQTQFLTGLQLHNNQNDRPQQTNPQPHLDRSSTLPPQTMETLPSKRKQPPAIITNPYAKKNNRSYHPTSPKGFHNITTSPAHSRLSEHAHEDQLKSPYTATTADTTITFDSDITETYTFNTNKETSNEPDYSYTSLTSG